jgi:hypothetical protein
MALFKITLSFVFEDEGGTDDLYTATKIAEHYYYQILENRHSDYEPTWSVDDLPEWEAEQTFDKWDYPEEG